MFVLLPSRPLGAKTPKSVESYKVVPVWFLESLRKSSPFLRFGSPTMIFLLMDEFAAWQALLSYQ